ncbi:MAG: hypothetical protein WBE26_06660 [Phycisphaerae bacterium]
MQVSLELRHETVTAQRAGLTRRCGFPLFRAGGSGDINARHVWWGWGNCYTDLIQDCIYDFFEDPGYGIVMFFPFSPPEPGGDANWDGAVDVDDYAAFNACFVGPCGVDCDPPVDPECSPMDFDCDYDVDLADFAEFQTAFTGGL